MADEKDERLSLDTEEKRNLKDQAVEQLIAEGILVSHNNITTRYLELYEEKYGKDVAAMPEETNEQMKPASLASTIENQLSIMNDAQILDEYRATEKRKKELMENSRYVESVQDVLLRELQRRGVNPWENTLDSPVACCHSGSPYTGETPTPEEEANND